MPRRLVTLLLGLLLPLALIAVACEGGTATVTFEPAPSATTPAAPAAPATAPASTAPSGGGVIIDLNATSNPYVFEPASITVKAGETITIQGDGQFHTFPVKDLDIDQAINPNATVTVTLNKPGTYQFICVPHQALGMVGTITVT